jgi:hypothetical protein
MNEVLSKLHIKESIFITENMDKSIHFLNQMIGISEEKNILCTSSFERRIVHILSHGLNLYHSRHGERNNDYKNNFDWQCKCKWCWKSAGEQYYKIIGVKISNVPLPLSRKDKCHQRNLR